MMLFIDDAGVSENLILTNDSLYPDTSILLHGNGTNGSNAIVDQLGNLWSAQGNAQISTTTPKYGSGCILLDGSGDYLIATRANALGTGNFTVECWIRIGSLANDGEIFCISHSDLNLSKFDLVFEYKTTGALRGSIQNGAGTANVDITSATGLLTTGTYYHVAFTANGTTATLWINGSSVATGTITGTRAQPNTQCRVGYLSNALSNTVTRYFNGRIDDLRVTKACRYTSSFTPPAAQLPSWYAITQNATYPVSAVTTDAQGVATNGTHVWFSSSTTIYKYTNSGSLVTSRNVSGDNPTDKVQVNGMYLKDGVLYVSAAKFTGGVGTSWIVQYDPDTLAYITHTTLGIDGFSEGLTFKNGYWWVVFHATKIVAQYDTSWNLITSHSLSFSITGSSGGYGSGQGYDGIAWYGSYILVNVHEIYNEDFLDVYYFNGTSFDQVARLGQPTLKATQGLAADPSNSTLLWFAERNYTGGTDSFTKCLIG